MGKSGIGGNGRRLAEARAKKNQKKEISKIKRRRKRRRW